MGKTVLAVVFLCFLIAFLISLHLRLVYGNWFDPSEVHHEAWIIAFSFLGIGVLIGSRAKK